VFVVVLLVLLMLACRVSDVCIVDSKSLPRWTSKVEERRIDDSTHVNNHLVLVSLLHCTSYTRSIRGMDLPTGLSPSFWRTWSPKRGLSVNESLDNGEEWIGSWDGVGLYEQSVFSHLCNA
jgi:hypothetical protein